MRLILVRHGQSEANLGNVLETASPGTDLTALGRQQAEALVSRLAHEPIAAVHASDARRAVQTASPLAAALGLEVAIHPELQEVSAAALEETPDWGGYLGTVDEWVKGRLDLRMPGGDDGHAVVRRAQQAIDRVVTQGSECAVVLAHGAVLRTWTHARADIPAQLRPVWLRNTDTIVLEGDPDYGWVLDSWADIWRRADLSRR